MSTDRDRLAPPGSAPTNEDLEHEVELTRQELGDTVAELVHKLDVKTRARQATQRQLTHLQDTARTTTDRARVLVRTHPAAIAAAAVTVVLAAVLVALRLRH